VDNYREGDLIRVLTGAFVGKRGKVTTIVAEQPKSVGVFLRVEGSPVFTTWFQPHEIEKEKSNG